MLSDEADITIRSGNGGPGAVSFRHEKFAPMGGPDGGDGGRGGDVVFVGSQHLNTLSPFIRRRRWSAPPGAKGGTTNCTGLSGADLEVPVPCGTLVRLATTGEVIADIVRIGQRVVIAAGGKGGGGNNRFKSSTNQAPRRFGPGFPGTELRLHLELKLIADVGIIGMPNAGKSTLLARLSAARPKIAPYPFTTLEPQLGVIPRDDRTLILADIPGLIEGASTGIGLGHRFLRHVERCRVLLHMVDATEAMAGSDGTPTPEEIAALLQGRIAIINHELARFSQVLAVKPQLIVVSKADAFEDPEALVRAVGSLIGQEVLAISAVSGYGLDTLSRRLWRWVDGDGEPAGAPS